MATAFWDCHGIISSNYLEKKETINGGYFANLLQQLCKKIKEERPYSAKKNMLFHQDNASAQKFVIAMAKIHELQFGFIDLQ